MCWFNDGILTWTNRYTWIMCCYLKNEYYICKYWTIKETQKARTAAKKSGKNSCDILAEKLKEQVIAAAPQTYDIWGELLSHTLYEEVNCMLIRLTPKNTK